MPKIIENAHGMLIDEAKKQIEENGYDAVTVRSIARSCGIGLGTFYNYFKSKDMLIATFLLEDWQDRMSRVTEQTSGDAEPIETVRLVYNELRAFIESHSNIFSSSEAIKAFNSSVLGKHRMLRDQVAAPILKTCADRGYENPVFLSQFVAEATLTWTVAQKSFDELEPIINKLFIK